MPTDKLQILTPIVTSVNGQAGDVTVATKTSELTNDSHFVTQTNLDEGLNGKVDKVEGKGLSTNDLTAALKSNYDAAYTHSQAAHAPTNAERNTIVGIQKNGTDVSINSNTRKVNITVPTKTSELTNDNNFATTSYVDTAVAGIVDSAPETLDTLNELSAALGDDPNFATTVANQIGTKVDKVTGKGLSTEDYTTTEKTKLSGIEVGAQKNTVTSVAGKTGAVMLAKADVGLGNVDNTSDVDKPISTATQTALNTKQPAITANGILKGDGTGNITAADETEVELVDITPELIGAQPKIIADGFLTSDGEGNVGAETPVFTVSVWLRGDPTQDETGQYIYDFGSNYNYEQIRSAQHRGYMVVVYYSGDIFYYTGENSNDGLIFSKIGKKYSTCAYDRLRCTSDDKWHQESNTLVSEEGIFPAANGRFTLPEIIQNLQTSVQDAAPYTKICSASVPTANWQGSDPYTQSISCGYDVTGSTVANIQLSDTLYDQLVTDGVTYLNIENTNGALFIKAKGGKPSVDLTLQITCTETRN